MACMWTHRYPPQHPRAGTAGPGAVAPPATPPAALSPSTRRRLIAMGRVHASAAAPRDGFDHMMRAPPSRCCSRRCKIGEEYFGDGAMRQIHPLSPANPPAEDDPPVGISRACPARRRRDRGRMTPSCRRRGRFSVHASNAVHDQILRAISASSTHQHAGAKRAAGARGETADRDADAGGRVSISARSRRATGARAAGLRYCCVWVIGGRGRIRLPAGEATSCSSR